MTALHRPRPGVQHTAIQRLMAIKFGRFENSRGGQADSRK
jgi:hypothetical protein